MQPTYKQHQGDKCPQNVKNKRQILVDVFLTSRGHLHGHLPLNLLSQEQYRRQLSSPPLNSCLPGEWSVLGAHKTNFELEVKGEANSINECQTHLKCALSSILNCPNNCGNRYSVYEVLVQTLECLSTFVQYFCSGRGKKKFNKPPGCLCLKKNCSKSI